MVWDGKGDGKRWQGDGEERPLPPLCLQFEPSSRCLSQWLLQRLLMVVEWGGVEWSAEAWDGVLCCAVLWWWKLCVFLCHIPIYINLVFAMTDDICQCQTFSFSISASPAAAAVVPAGKDVQVLAPFGLKVTFPKVSPQRPRPQNILHFSPFKLAAPAPAGRRPTHEFDEFDVKYFCCFPHSFFMKSIF